MAKRRERGTGGLIKIRGCRFWYAQVYRNGKQCRISTKTEVKQEAQGVLRNLLVDKDRGVQFVGDLKKVRYGDLRAGLLQNYVERGNKSLLVHADGEEFINGLEVLDKFFEYGPDKAGVSVAQITTDAAREFAKQRLAGGVTNSTVNNSLALLRRMLMIGHEDGKIRNVPKIRLLKANPARKGFLVPEKFEELVNQLPEPLKPLIVFLYYCGVRLGEALQVDWSQVDLVRHVIRLEADQTKDSEARVVPLPNVLLAMLERVEPKKGPVFEATNLRKAWARACTAAGLGQLGPVDQNGDRRYSGLLIHDLRRSAIKNLMKMGVNEKTAMAISGHKTRAVFDRYHIVDESDVLEAMRRVEAGNGESIVKIVPRSRHVKRLNS